MPSRPDDNRAENSDNTSLSLADAAIILTNLTRWTRYFFNEICCYDSCSNMTHICSGNHSVGLITSPFNLANAKALGIAPGQLPICKVYIAVVRLIWRRSQANSSFSSLNRRLPVLRQVVGPREDGQKGHE